MISENLNQQKIILLSFLKGHKKAGELIAIEKKKRLVELTTEESLREYDDLCSMWDRNPAKTGMEKIQAQKILFHVNTRKLFNIAAISEKKP